MTAPRIGILGGSGVDDATIALVTDDADQIPSFR